MIYKGSCHCGQIAFEVEGELTQVMDCNCSICSRKGSLNWPVPRQQLRLLTPQENMSTYTFGKHTVKHRFCSKCGMHPFCEGPDPSGNHMALVNVRCLEGVEFSSLPVKPFNGRDL
ncbi:MAG: GFA family protein [Sulfuricaulis sp.]|uniref:GFA family protein n=1 Tax=Sulfuricaulis sp. TaxID=2003553 RepID=UPI0034A473ED